MKDPVKLIKKIWRSGLISFVVSTMMLGGLFLNLGVVGATDGDLLASPTPSPSASPTPTPSPSPSDQNPPSFPRCIDQSGVGDKAHYVDGFHQIVGNGLLEGKDDVYTLTNGNYLQCYVPLLEDVCIQTSWWRTDQVLAGWYSVNGSQWNLGNLHYLAKNINYNCKPEPSPSPSPSPTPTVSPSPSTSITIINNNENKQEQNNNQTVNVTATGQVAGVKVPTKTPETGVSILGLTSMFGAGPVGFALSRFGRGRTVSRKREETLGETALDLFNKRSGGQA